MWGGGRSGHDGLCRRSGRGAGAHVRRPWCAVRSGTGSHRANLPARTFVSVSYTHLDVYKRQRVGDDAELFEELRDLRRELADEHQVPAYIICSDATLRGMCRKLSLIHI